MIIHIVWLKYVPFIIVGFAFAWLVYKIIRTEHLLDFIKKSMCEENGKPSGRSIAGFACINAMIIGFFVSMYYSPDHCPPDWYVETMAFLIGSFYGLREVGKFAKNGNSNVDVGSQSFAPVSPPPVVKKTGQDAGQDVGQNNGQKNDEIG